MIRFPCKCGHVFNLTEDQAGGLVQCPRCALLADVPTLNDLKHLNADGTFGFRPEEGPVDHTTAADLHRFFTRNTVDSHGHEKDLRNGPEHFQAIGTELEGSPPRVAPRYDPITGELIRPIEIKDDTPVPVIPIGELVDPAPVDSEAAAMEVQGVQQIDPPPVPVVPIPASPRRGSPRALSYAVGHRRGAFRLRDLVIELLMGGNPVVLFFVTLLYVMAYYTAWALSYYTDGVFKTIWPFFILNLPMWLIVSHIGCVVESTGPDDLDELPRPLRDFSFGDDVIAPWFRVMRAIFFCFTPAVVLYMRLDPLNPMTLPIVGLFTLLAVVFFPAVLLSSVTGSVIENMRPDRVLGVIQQCGLPYLFSVFLFVIAAVPTVYFTAGQLLFPPLPAGPVVDRLQRVTVTVPLMMFTVYLLHLFCWHLGSMYRANHAQFPWILQWHVKTQHA